MKRFVLFIAVLGCFASLAAQSTYVSPRIDSYPFGFVQLGAGASTEVSNKNPWSPSVSLALGAGFSKEVSARLQVTGFKQKTDLKSVGKNVDFNYINANVDVLFNVINIFKQHYYGRLTPYLIGGIGYDRGWGYDKMFRKAKEYGATEKMGSEYDVVNSVNLRAGLLLDFIINEKFNIGVEGTIAALNDDFNGRIRDKNDKLVNLQAVLTYKFGGPKKSSVVPAVPATPVEVTRPAVQTPVVEKKVPVKQFVPHSSAIYFEQSKHEILSEYRDIVPQAAKWARENPDKKLIVSGYADKATGNPTVNMNVSLQRAQAVKDALKAAGVPEDRIVINAYGDTVQPFADSAKNRCAILKGE